MSLTRRKLTKAEIVDHVARARQMQAFGIEVEIPQDWLRVAAAYQQVSAGVEIEQFGGLNESTVFELASGRLGYVIAAMITNQTAKPIYCGDVQLRVPWEDEFFEWLSPIEVPGKFRKQRDSSYQAYRFPDKLGLELPYDDVVNHILMEGQALLPGRPVRGLLLATGGIMPPDLQHGQWLSAALVIVGTDHREYSQEIQLWTERLESRPKPVIMKKQSARRFGTQWRIE